MYPLAVRFPGYGAFAEASIPQLLSPSQLRQAVHYEADTFASVYLQNNGKGTFSSFALPTLAQISPIKGIIAEDVDGDGKLDLIVAGNLYGSEPNTPRADAGNGLWLKGDGHGHFTPVPPVESGFPAASQVEEALPFHGQLEPAFVPHGRSGKGLNGPRRGVLADLVVRPRCHQRIATGSLDQRQGDFIVPHACGIPVGQYGIGGPRPTPLGGLPGSCSDLIDD